MTVTGRPDHAGTTPMEMRADAFLVAAKAAVAANEAALRVGEGTVATVGKVQVQPGSFNIVAGKVTFYIDIRSKKLDVYKRQVHRRLGDLSDPFGHLHVF